MATRSTNRTARTSIVSKTLADLADVLPQGNTPLITTVVSPEVAALRAEGKLPQTVATVTPLATVAPKAKGKAKAMTSTATAPIAVTPPKPYAKPSSLAVIHLVNSAHEADKSLYGSCVTFCNEVGPISEDDWNRDIAPMFDAACKAVKANAKRKAEFKVFLICYSNGLRIPASDFTTYVRLIRKNAGFPLLIKPSNRGAKPRTTDKASATPKSNGKGSIAAEAANANSATSAKTSQLDHAQSLLGNRDLAAFLVRACETGNRDQLVKYLKDTFPTPKA